MQNTHNIYNIWSCVCSAMSKFYHIKFDRWVVIYLMLKCYDWRCLELENSIFLKEYDMKTKSFTISYKRNRKVERDNKETGTVNSSQIFLLLRHLRCLDLLLSMTFDHRNTFLLRLFKKFQKKSSLQRDNFYFLKFSDVSDKFSRFWESNVSPYYLGQVFSYGLEMPS